jgi:hypothetical protein
MFGQPPKSLHLDVILAVLLVLYAGDVVADQVDAVVWLGSVDGNDLELRAMHLCPVARNVLLHVGVGADRPFFGPGFTGYRLPS